MRRAAAMLEIRERKQWLDAAMPDGNLAEIATAAQSVADAAFAERTMRRLKDEGERQRVAALDALERADANRKAPT
jgi:hypothetical protein